MTWTPSFPTASVVKSEIVIESPKLGTITLRPRKKLRYLQNDGFRVYKQSLQDGPWLRINDDSFRWKVEDCYFFWYPFETNGGTRWRIYRHDPDWITNEGLWKSVDYEYFGRELTDRLRGIS